MEGCGPPFEWLVSRVCEEFGCTPDVALTLPTELTLRVLDLRSYARAKQRIEDPSTKEQDVSRADREQVGEVMEELQRRRRDGRK